MSKLLAAMIAALWVVSAGSAKASDWNGFYLGANAGAAFGDDTSATSTVFSPTGY